MPSKIYFIGFCSNVRDDWQTFAVSPQAAKNLKDPEKIAQSLENKTIEQVNIAMGLPVLARISEVAILNRDFQPVVNAASITNNGLLTFLQDEFPAGLYNQHVVETGSRLIGFGVRDFLRIAALQDLPVWPTEFWWDERYQVTAAIDPYADLFKADVKAHVTCDKLCKHLGIELQLDGTAHRAAIIAGAMVKALGLF